MKLKQNDWEWIKDQVQQGKMTIEQSHVQQVKMRRVLVVESRIPMDVRRILNAAVKSGELGHMKKDGHKPEVYFHSQFDCLARQERYRVELEYKRALLGVLA